MWAAASSATWPPIEAPTSAMRSRSCGQVLAHEAGALQLHAESPSCIVPMRSRITARIGTVQISRHGPGDSRAGSTITGTVELERT